MNVTFFENQPFYPISDIQGEQFTQKYQLWDMNTSPLMSPNISPSSVVLEFPTPELPESMSETSNKGSEAEPVLLAINKKLRVYARRNKTPVGKVLE